MSEFTIADKDFASLSEQVVIVTGTAVPQNVANQD